MEDKGETNDIRVQSTGLHCTPEVLKHALTSFIIQLSFATRYCIPVKSVKSRLIGKTNAFPKQGI